MFLVMGTDRGLDDRLADLERRFGDPHDRENPIGYTAILAADERAEMLRAGEQTLDEYGLGAEFVPAEHGGRLTRLEHLVDVMRSVYRRDPCLGLGYGSSSLIGAVNVWASGDLEQCRMVADVLLRNRMLACAYHELAHGNDIARNEFEARSTGSGLSLSGKKEVIANVERAAALVIFARTDAKAGGRSHSQILVDRASLSPDSVRYLPRFRSAGMRGVHLGGIEFQDCTVPTDSVVGFAGQGLETALTSFQITRTVLPAMTVGILDTGLRTTIAHVTGRKLYGGTAIDFPYVRSILVGAFLDLLISDCVGTVIARAAHLIPAQLSVYASAAKYLIPKIVIDAMDRLSEVLGSEFYLREGDSAIFQKLLRDVRPAGFGHASGAACQLTILPQLPALARKSWAMEDPVSPALFALDHELPSLRFDRLKISNLGRDQLGASLGFGLDGESDFDAPDREVGQLRALFATEFQDLGNKVAQLSPAEVTPDASSDTYDLASRYAILLAASCCIGVWRHNQNRSDEIISSRSWLIAALGRLADRLKTSAVTVPTQADDYLFAEMMDRFEGRRTFDLAARRVFG
ncbi:acyl-CoA dehydrogenase [Rugosimonospora africana]|uniref:Acyl-CoA dehydrogenase n=1 Tax=Rugosimonospora africana TaxID=556532 RepID=A0A8J3R4T0_9ACTN|nr:acyl-CoA dehydrogenase [Rugosimonospora africana]GIH21320.1 acyl-CoA dehydrogenase [Rugosimonospora africana]